MTQEDKNLLLKDLCTRLPYGTKLNIKGQDGPTLYNFDEDLYTIWIEGRFSINDRGEGDEDGICEIKPYLRPMSSMTEEEQEELDSLWNEGFGEALDAQLNGKNDLEVKTLEITASYKSIQWLLKNHFDYHGLIEKGIAIEASKEMYKNEN